MRIEHVAMYVNSLKEARDFFVRYFGAVSNEGYHNKKTDFRSYFLTFEDGARLELMNRPGMEDPEKTGARTRVYSPGLQRRKPGGGGRPHKPPAGGRLRSLKRAPRHRGRLLRKLRPGTGGKPDRDHRIEKQRASRRP